MKDRRLVLIGGTALLLGGLYAVRLRPPGPAVYAPEKRKPMPAEKFTSMAGVPWSAGDFKGQVVLLNFWATWCAPCREETPDLIRAWEHYRERGVQFAGASLDEDPEEVVPAFLKQYRIEYPILVTEPTSLLVQAVQVIPTSFLIDRQGRVARVWTGILREDELRRGIDALLAEGAPAGQ